ncbi:transposase [Rhizobium beringeri]
MFKALFIGYLFGIRSERQLVREIEVNVAQSYLSDEDLRGSNLDTIARQWSKFHAKTQVSCFRELPCRAIAKCR